MRTFIPKQKNIKRKWHLIDAKGKILGRLASEIAIILRGKDKPEFTKHLDIGDYVVLINSKQIRVTGDKYKKKKYYRYSGYPGGLKEQSLEDLIKKDPCEPIKKAVYRMLPANKLRNNIMKRLYCYPDEKHPHEAQLRNENNVVKRRREQ